MKWRSATVGWRRVVPRGASKFTLYSSAAALLVMLWAVSPARAASAYDELIAPMLRARCVECHGEKKQKAKLALHTWESLVRGSDSGPVFVAGKAAESALVDRMRLPLADDEHMPPPDKAQPAAEEIALLAHWIEQGASRSATLADLKLPDPLASAARDLPTKLNALADAQAHADPVWEFDAAKVTMARAPLAARVAELQRRFPGALSYESRTAAALHFTAAGLGRDFGDAELAALAPLREHLAVLDLSGTGITDRSAPVFAEFAGLRVLRAGFTTVGDPIVAALAALPKVESLSLHESAVTAASVAAFSKLPALRSLRLGGTAALEAARAAGLPVGVVARDD